MYQVYNENNVLVKATAEQVEKFVGHRGTELPLTMKRNKPFLYVVMSHVPPVKRSGRLKQENSA